MEIKNEKGNETINTILHFLKGERGFDFLGYRFSMIERRIQKRILATKCRSINEYSQFIKFNPNEIDNLIDVFTINVSHFFRNPLAFEIIKKILIPDLVLNKTKENDNSLRIWSAGCSFGEEAYSIAIIINEFFGKEKTSILPRIIATDIDKKALKIANEASYNVKSIQNVKYSIAEKYFKKENDKFVLSNEIKKMVQFSFFDLTDKIHEVPPESIFGGFDIVFCRNVLIYFNLDYQKIVFNKLYKSLNKNGYLVLGDAETPIESFKHNFIREGKLCKIYRKK